MLVKDGREHVEVPVDILVSNVRRDAHILPAPFPCELEVHAPIAGEGPDVVVIEIVYVIVLEARMLKRLEVVKKAKHIKHIGSDIELEAMGRGKIIPSWQDIYPPMDLIVSVPAPALLGPH